MNCLLCSCKDSYTFTCSRGFDFVPIDCLFWISVPLLFPLLPPPSSFHVVRCTQYERGSSTSVSLPSLIALPAWTSCRSNGGKCRNHCQIYRRKQVEKCSCFLKDAFFFFSDITWTFVCSCFVPSIIFNFSLQLELANWIPFSEELRFLYLASATAPPPPCSAEINMVDFVSLYCKLAWWVESWPHWVIASTESVGSVGISIAPPEEENGGSPGRYTRSFRQWSWGLKRAVPFHLHSEVLWRLQKPWRALLLEVSSLESG